MPALTANEAVTYRACPLCEAICGLEIRTRGGEVLKEEFGTHPSVYYLPSRRKDETLAHLGSKSREAVV